MKMFINSCGYNKHCFNSVMLDHYDDMFGKLSYEDTYR